MFWILSQSSRLDMARAFYITIFLDPRMYKQNGVKSHKKIHRRSRRRERNMKRK
jgi:hypothetical protein